VDRSSGSLPRSSRRTWTPRLVAVGAVAVLALLIASGFASSNLATRSSSGAVLPRGSSGATAVAGHSAPSVSGSPPAAPTPANNTTFDPNCAKINTTVCVSIAHSYEPNIVPAAGGYFAPVEPTPKTDLPLYLKSRYQITPTNSVKYGPESPIALNVTGVLWNGDTYATPDDGTVWHADNNTWWSGPQFVAQDPSYPYWYTLDIAANTSTGTQNFFAGETVTWWVELTSGSGNVFTHLIGPQFQFTYGQAWPFSPYPGIPQSDGPNATFNDISPSVHPLAPNWNDSVTVTVNTTLQDGVPTNATIGAAQLRFIETVNSVTLYDTAFPFPVSGNASVGAVTTSYVIGAQYAQVSGAVVSYQIVASDIAGDQIATPFYSYTIGGNGSFLSGTFTDDIEVASSPAAVAAAAGVSVTVNPGQDVNITITSLNPGTAINAAEIVEYFSYPSIGEKVVTDIPMTRVSSTIFAGSLPGLPVGSFVNFTVDAWDFDQHQLISPAFSYLTPSFTVAVPFVPGNASFFYVFVYDNGSHTWVSNASVQVMGPRGFFNSVGHTVFGVAYPNASQQPYTPLLLAANESYMVSVTDPGFANGNPLNATVYASHALTTRQTLVAGSNYYVVQEGNALLFYLNQTAPPPTASPSVPSPGLGDLPLAALIASLATVGTAIPLYLWWRQIRQRRKEEEKRVTL
jgi:hypothetical protein